MLNHQRFGGIINHCCSPSGTHAHAHAHTHTTHTTTPLHHYTTTPHTSHNTPLHRTPPHHTQSRARTHAQTHARKHARKHTNTHTHTHIAAARAEDMAPTATTAGIWRRSSWSISILTLSNFQFFHKRAAGLFRGLITRKKNYTKRKLRVNCIV